MPKAVYTPIQIAKGLEVSKIAVYQWLQKGELKGFKAGKLWRVTREDLEEFLGRPVPWEESMITDGDKGEKI